MTLSAWTFALTDRSEGFLAIAVVSVEAQYCGVRGKKLVAHPCLRLSSEDWMAVEAELASVAASGPLGQTSPLVDLLTRGLGTVIRVNFLHRVLLEVEAAQAATVLDTHLRTQVPIATQ